MIKLDLQFFGGRGSGSYSGSASSGGSIMGGGGSGGGASTDMNVAGWTPEAGSRRVSSATTLNSAESRIQNLDHEQMVVVDRDGYVVAAVDGGAHSVSFTDRAYRAAIAGGTVTHNHPNGGTFSGTDIVSAGSLGITEIRAVSKRFGTTYSLKAGNKANGTGLASAMKRADKRLAKQWDAKIEKINKKKYANEANYEKAVYSAYNEVMGGWLSTNAKKYGYTYSSHKTGSYK